MLLTGWLRRAWRSLGTARGGRSAVRSRRSAVAAAGGAPGGDASHPETHAPLPPGPSVTFFGGKGGVGKTTCAAAYALQLAAAGERTLLVSTDPAHSLGDLLAWPLTGHAQTVASHLDALEVDPERALARYLSEVRHNIDDVTSPELRDIAARQVELAGRAPGAADAALLDEVVRLLLASTGYAQLVFDTAPTGHTLQLLALPEQIGAWTEGLLAQRRGARERWQDADPGMDRAAQVLDARRQRFAAARALLRDPARTRFVPVLNPDALSRDETGRMIETLAAAGIPVDTVIVNRVLPAEAGGDFIARRRQAEARHLAAIDRDFGHLARIRLPLAADDVGGPAALAPLGRRLAVLR